MTDPLTELVYATGTQASQHAHTLLAGLTPAAAPDLFRALSAAWQAASANPAHNWRWSEAAVARVFRAQPLAAAEVLRPWFDPPDPLGAGLPLLGMAVQAVYYTRDHLPSELRHQVFYLPEKLWLTPAPPHPDVLAHHALAPKDALALPARQDILRLVAQKHTPAPVMVAALASAWRHLYFRKNSGDVETPSANLLWNVAAHAGDEATALILLALHDDDPDLRALAALTLEPNAAAFDPAQLEPLIHDGFHTVVFRAIQFFKAMGHTEAITRALHHPGAAMYAAQVIVHWHTHRPALLAQLRLAEAPLRARLAAIRAKPDPNLSEASWLLQALEVIGREAASLPVALSYLTVHDANTRQHASLAASALASRLPLAEQATARLAIQNYHLIECAACHHRFNGWAGPYRTGVVLHCPKCRDPMVRHHLGWEWLGAHRDLNRYKKLPALMPYDAE